MLCITKNNIGMAAWWGHTGVFEEVTMAESCVCLRKSHAPVLLPALEQTAVTLIEYRMNEALGLH